jgi:hypothetical protein
MSAFWKAFNTVLITFWDMVTRFFDLFNFAF